MNHNNNHVHIKWGNYKYKFKFGLYRMHISQFWRNKFRKKDKWMPAQRSINAPSADRDIKRQTALYRSTINQIDAWKKPLKETVAQLAILLTSLFFCHHLRQIQSQPNSGKSELTVHLLNDWKAKSKGKKT